MSLFSERVSWEGGSERHVEFSVHNHVTARRQLQGHLMSDGDESYKKRKRRLKDIYEKGIDAVLFIEKEG
jgi:hypothetical protein